MLFVRIQEARKPVLFMINCTDVCQDLGIFKASFNPPGHVEKYVNTPIIWGLVSFAAFFFHSRETLN